MAAARTAHCYAGQFDILTQMELFEERLRLADYKFINIALTRPAKKIHRVFPTNTICMSTSTSVCSWPNFAQHKQ